MKHQERSPSNHRAGSAPTLLAAMIAIALAIPSPSHAQNFVPAGPGVEVGPNGNMNGADLPQPGQPTNVPPNFGTQSGAIQTIAVNPFNPNLMLVGSPNGGIFRSTDAGKTWTPMIDGKASLSMGGISFDTTDASGMTVIAGIGNDSSGAPDPYIANRGGITNKGLLYSTNGGASWTNLGQGTLPDVSFLNVVARGSVIMAAGFEEEKANTTSGLYRSTDGGKSFARVDQISSSGLPPGATSALVGDPKDPNRFYVGVTGTSNTAVYTSTDSGKTWTQIFSAANANGAINTGTNTMLRLAAGPGGSVLVGVVNAGAGQMTNAFLSQNNGKSWTDLSAALAANTVSNGSGPSTNPSTGSNMQADHQGDDAVRAIALSAQLAKYGESSPNLSINPGGQATIHSVVAIDPNNPNVVYLAGDRVGAIPGPTGAPGWSAAAMRVTVNADGSLAYAPLTDNFTSDHSTVHPDCRAFAFDGNGNLLMGTDGGVYYRTNPSSTSGYWRGLNWGRQALEIYSASLDPNSGLIAVAAQDNGEAMQSGKNRSIYNVVGGGDGTVAAINGQSTPGSSYTYVASQYLGGFTRFRTDAKGNFLDKTSTDIYFAPDAGGAFSTDQYGNVEIDANTVNFVPSFKLNNVDKSLMVLGVNPGVMVAQDDFTTAPTPYTNGDTACVGGCYKILQSYFGGATALVSSLDFGTQDNKYALLAGTFLYTNQQTGQMARLFVSTGTSIDTINMQPVYSYPVSMRAPGAVLFDPRSQNRFFAASPDAPGIGFLWSTTDGGATGTNLTRNLPTNFIRPGSLGFINSNGVNALLVGGLNSADNAGNPLVAADSDANGALSNWRRFGSGLPNAQVSVIDYQPALDAMAIGTFGRGAFMLYDVTSNFAQAKVLQFGLANNDSNPDASLLSGNRPLIKYGSGTLTINGAAAYSGGTTVNSGALVLNGSVQNDLSLAAAGTLAGSGSVGGTLHVLGGTVQPGSATGTTLTVGALNNTGGGALQVSYNPATGQNTQLAITGNADITGMMLSLTQAGSAAPQFYRLYNLLKAGSLTGQFVNAGNGWVSTPTSTAVSASSVSQAIPTGGAPASTQQRISYSMVPNSVMLEMIQPINWTATAGNSNQRSVGNALNTLQYSGSSSFLAALNNVAAGSMPRNLDAISGESSVAAARSVDLATDRFLSTIGAQMLDAPGCRDARNEQVTSCHPLGKDIGEHRLWAEGMNISSRLRGEFNPNYFSGGGIAAGLEISLGEHGKIGGALGYSEVSTQVPNLSSKVRSHYGMVALYGDYQAGPWFIGGVLSQSDGANYADRTINLGAGGVQNVNAKPGLSSTAFRLNSGFNFRFAHDWYVTPYGEVTRAKSSQESYTESGSSPLALSYSGINQTRYQGELGMKLGKSFSTGSMTIEPYASLAEVFAWGDRAPSAQASFTSAPGTSFLVRGNALPSSWITAQAGLHLALNKSTLIDVSYQGVLDSRLRDDRFNAGLSWRF
ncbi:autotransporter domain-containing protein [Dyella subtropica]|uniref:autotransporter domain-containing protein n=1 Tax=Dyella subtropica TaxID=2992127 RepID=UPI002255E27B|nr:autotransporter domain-containing protein [Dyella subtropica]